MTFCMMSAYLPYEHLHRGFGVSSKVTQMTMSTFLVLLYERILEPVYRIPIMNMKKVSFKNEGGDNVKTQKYHVNQY